MAGLGMFEINTGGVWVVKDMQYNSNIIYFISKNLVVCNQGKHHAILDLLGLPAQQMKVFEIVKGELILSNNFRTA